MATPLNKLAALKADVALQPHQRRVSDLAADHPLRMLLVHSLGSGKSLSGLAAAERLGEPYTAVAPASLRQNYLKEVERFTDRKTPSDVMSYTALAQGREPAKGTVIFDEAHHLRNPDSARTRAAVRAADAARQVVMLSGSPVVNRPGDLAVPLRMLTGRRMTPDEFEARYTKVNDVYPSFFHRILGWSSGKELGIDHEDELRESLRGHVDWHAPDRPVVPTQYEDVPVEMGPEQVRLYDAMWDKLPWYVKWKLKNDVGLTDAELQRTLSFLTGPRQAGLSTYPYMRRPDPEKAFQQSTKLQEAMRRLRETLKDPRSRALVFSNFIDAGLTPYAAGLAAAKVPHGVFHGGLTDADRKKLVEDYNEGRIRVALLGPSGTEGLSFKGTNLVQLLDPYWNPVRPRQSVGRGLRYDSHLGLPEELRNVKVQRFLSRLPKGVVDKFLSAVGFDRTEPTLATDDRLAAIARRKEERNARFMSLLKSIGTEGRDGIEKAATRLRVWARANPGRVQPLINKGFLPDKWQQAQQVGATQRRALTAQEVLQENPFVSGTHSRFLPSYNRLLGTMPGMDSRFQVKGVLGQGEETLALRALDRTTRQPVVVKLSPGTFKEFPEARGLRPMDAPTLARHDVPTDPNLLFNRGGAGAKAVVQPMGRLDPEGRQAITANLVFARRLTQPNAMARRMPAWLRNRLPRALTADALHTDLDGSVARQTALFKTPAGNWVRRVIDPSTLVGAGPSPTLGERINFMADDSRVLASARYRQSAYSRMPGGRGDTPEALGRVELSPMSPAVVQKAST